MKRIFALLFILFVHSSNAQKIGLQQLEFTSQLESIEEKSDFFMSKQFAKQSSNKDSTIKFVKKNFVKKTQDFDRETITISGDTITYSLQDPKKFANFKKGVENFYKRLPDSPNNKVTYRKKRFTIILTETEISPEDSNPAITVYNFSILNNDL